MVLFSLHLLKILTGIPLRMQSIDKQIQYRFGNESYLDMMSQRRRVFLRFYWGTALWIGCVCAVCGIVCAVALWYTNQMWDYGDAKYPY